MFPTEAPTSTRTQIEVLDEAGRLASQLLSKGVRAPKDPHALARLCALREEAGLDAFAFVRGLGAPRGLAPSSLLLWSKGKKSDGSPWPALAQAIAERRGGALAAVMDAGIVPSSSPSAPSAPIPGPPAADPDATFAAHCEEVRVVLRGGALRRSTLSDRSLFGLGSSSSRRRQRVARLGEVLAVLVERGEVKRAIVTAPSGRREAHFSLVGVEAPASARKAATRRGRKPRAPAAKPPRAARRLGARSSAAPVGAPQVSVMDDRSLVVTERIAPDSPRYLELLRQAFAQRVAAP